MINHTQIIYNIAAAAQYQSYLELGLYNGETIELVNSVVPNCVGVDINIVNINCNFFHGNTNDFFKQNTQTFDMIFIDADHTYESVKIDFQNALNILNTNGVIILHDTDPVSKQYLQPGYCGDAYKIINNIEQTKELNIVTIPVQEAGLSIVNRKLDRRLLNYV